MNLSEEKPGGGPGAAPSIDQPMLKNQSIRPDPVLIRVSKNRNLKP
jgi:hypothetical protein